MNRLRVLASAFSCHSGADSGLGGGEDILGWSMVQQLARFHDVWAITYAANKASLEQTLKDEPNPNLHFQYLVSSVLCSRFRAGISSIISSGR